MSSSSIFVDAANEKTPLIGKSREEGWQHRSTTGEYVTGTSRKRSLLLITYSTDDEKSKSNHCHSDVPDYGVDKIARKKLVTASIVCLFFMIGEIIGGALAHSLAIMTDAAHLLTDFASFMISLLAIYLAARPATRKLTFGWHRAEVVGALVSVLLIWVVTGILVYMAVRRIIDDDYEINGKVMLITSVISVCVNILMMITLQGHGHTHGGGGGHGHSHGGGASHGHSHENGKSQQHGHSHQNAKDVNYDYQALNDKTELGINNEPVKNIATKDGHIILQIPSNNNSPAAVNSEIDDKRGHQDNINVRAAFIHVIGDLLQSIGVFIAAMVIYFRPDLKIADPICTFLFSALVLFTTINILIDTLRVLMEAVPHNVAYQDVKAALYSLDGIIEVHNLRIWSLTTHKISVSVHVAIDETSNPQDILRRTNELLRRRFHVHDATVQVERYIPEMSECRKCKEPLV